MRRVLCFSLCSGIINTLPSLQFGFMCLISKICRRYEKC
jgi:hypothetical protein